MHFIIYIDLCISYGLFEISYHFELSNLSSHILECRVDPCNIFCINHALVVRWWFILFDMDEWAYLTFKCMLTCWESWKKRKMVITVTCQCMYHLNLCMFFCLHCKGGKWQLYYPGLFTTFVVGVCSLHYLFQVTFCFYLLVLFLL